MAVNMYKDPYVTLEHLQDEGLVPKHNFSARREPTLADYEGYTPGSLWYVSAATPATGSTNRVWTCVRKTVSGSTTSIVWQPLGTLGTATTAASA